jgi:6-phosphogluconate dehydrogenase
MATDGPMQLGMVGLGRMGANLVRRLMRDGHQCVAYDRKPDVVKSLEAEGAAGASSYEEFVRKLDRPRNIWIMIPAGVVQPVLDRLVPLLNPDDIVIDGGNSYYRDDITRAAALRPAGIHYVDIGTSGGVWGLKRGYCLMIGGQAEAVQRLDPIFKTLAPGAGSAEPHHVTVRAVRVATGRGVHGQDSVRNAQRIRWSRREGKVGRRRVERSILSWP